MKKYLLILILSIAVTFSYGQTELVKKYAETITIYDLTKHMEILSSDKYEGRDTGKEGQKLAADYIKAQFKEENLTGPSPSKDPYFQEFDLIQRNYGSYFKNEETKIESEIDFFSTNVAQSGEKDVEIIFMGYGIDHENYSDYKGIDVKGKIVVYFKGEPIDKNKKYLTTLSVQPTNFARLKQQKIDTAIKKGALGTIRIDPVEKKAAYLIKSRGNFSRLEINSDIIKESEAKYHFFMTPSAASKLLGISETKFLGSIKKLNKGINLSGKYSSKILMVVQDKLIPTENVVGYIEGSDKKDELIIITAHYDHVGKRNDKIYNGADDNASGTVAIIEIAEAFAQAKAEGHGPRRSILFMPVTGEEKGLLGSKYYAQYKPIFPIENTVLCINMDMIGRIDKKHEEQQNYVYNSSSGYESSDLHNINLKAENNVHSDLKPEYSFVGDSGRISGGSDHYSFFTVNVPVMYFRCGIHDDYHKPTDTIEKINFKNFCNITKLVFSTAWEAANYEGEISIEE